MCNPSEQGLVHIRWSLMLIISFSKLKHSLHFASHRLALWGSQLTQEVVTEA